MAWSNKEIEVSTKDHKQLDNTDFSQSNSVFIAYYRKMYDDKIQRICLEFNEYYGQL